MLQGFCLFVCFWFIGTIIEIPFTSGVLGVGEEILRDRQKTWPKANISAWLYIIFYVIFSTFPISDLLYENECVWGVALCFTRGATEAKVSLQSEIRNCRKSVSSAANSLISWAWMNTFLLWWQRLVRVWWGGKQACRSCNHRHSKHNSPATFSHSGAFPLTGTYVW